MKPYKYFLFDVDGTLIDTTELIYQCFCHTCNRFANMTPDRSKVIKNIGLTLRKQMEVYFGKLSDQDFAVRAEAHMSFQLSIYKKYLRVFPTVIEGLETLKTQGAKCAVVTSRRRESLDLYLKEMGIFDYFDIIVSPENTQKHKPDPEPALCALSLLKASDPSLAVFIGDSEFDIGCGANAGIDTGFVTWSFSTPESLPVKPTFLISDFSQLSV